MWRCIACLCPTHLDENRTDTALHAADVSFISFGKVVVCSSSWCGLGRSDVCSIVHDKQYHVYLRSPWIYWSNA